MMTTAYGPGPDGVVRIYGLSAQSACATDFFLEDPEQPLTLTRFGDSGTAKLTGGIINDEDSLVKFDVEMYFVMEENAADWMANTPGAGLMTAWDCEVVPEALTVYSLNNFSKLTGTGSLQGQLSLNHMPVSESKRFQLGQGANNHNCEYGFAGWFGWQGVLNNEEVMGFSGDVIADLGAPSFQDTDCGGEFVELTYAVVDPISNTSVTYNQRRQWKTPLLRHSSMPQRTRRLNGASCTMKIAPGASTSLASMSLTTVASGIRCMSVATSLKMHAVP